MGLDGGNHGSCLQKRQFAEKKKKSGFGDVSGALGWESRVSKGLGIRELREA